VNKVLGVITPVSSRVIANNKDIIDRHNSSL
jgi:hypothetical protein